MKATGTEAQVIADITQRQQMGLIKYRTTVAENPLDLKQWLQHAYEESLDFCVYLRRAIQEIEKNGIQAGGSNGNDIQSPNGN